MVSVSVNPPKTPVTEGSMDMAPATLPNVCKMPGPPAPFVPVPLPNFGRSADRLKECTSTVFIEGKKIAIKGSYYMSAPSPDVASQGTGGGIVSSKTQGMAEFVAPGSMDVKAEGKNIQLLGDAMSNNG
ncbi:PAAR-like domain-containing protein [Mesorhizobium sangaii]|uniref:Putative Zn-binding protein involved in type VI secretion n=1 Tax=Mesorhizobium sangaii TaxID=505389 RepID=A0A841P6Z6_9HYPH|nr:PAAR-like domain-containing protein [Mesorhizobium sangaii]MBB6408618.1 putative Zn-binding protein involved in type VI secretion [Mesorhizobium sangaii]